MLAQTDEAAQPITVPVAYLYPWDCEDPALPDQLHSLGIGTVALAAAYHSVRAATPTHPSRRIVVASHSALYPGVRDSAWKGHQIRPHTPGPWVQSGAFENARRNLGDAGLNVRAWIVVSHHDDITRAETRHRVVNAYGETYSYALCPSSPAVRRYAETLVREVAEIAGPDGIVLEATGQLGAEHRSEHDKTDAAAWTSRERELLCMCFCRWCTKQLEFDGVDPRELRQTVMKLLSFDKRTAASERILRSARTARRASAKGLLDGVLAATGDLHVDLHATPEAGATGPFVELGDDVPAVSSCVVPTGGTPRAVDVRLRSASATLKSRNPRTTLSAHVALPPRPSADRLAALWTQHVAAGARELHLYHLGLASHTTRISVSEALTALHTAPTRKDQLP